VRRVNRYAVFQTQLLITFGVAGCELTGGVLQMIEPIMYFGIGYLFALLLALAIAPHVHRRAVRLTMRRLEAAIPRSMAEIQADKDLQRAEFAMSTRRLEMSVEQLNYESGRQRAEIGRKADVINRLKIEHDAKDVEIVLLKAKLDAVAGRVAYSDNEVDTTASGRLPYITPTVALQRLVIVAVVIAIATAGPVIAGEITASEARSSIIGKLFSYTCFDRTHGTARVYPDGSVVGSIQFQGAGPDRYAAMPAGTLRVDGERVCASLRGLIVQPCFNLERTSVDSFRGSVQGLNLAYCDFTQFKAHTDVRDRKRSVQRRPEIQAVEKK
jgi:hypothetical protein